MFGVAMMLMTSLCRDDGARQWVRESGDREQSPMNCILFDDLRPTSLISSYAWSGAWRDESFN
jgi:hypothetical protein